MTDKPKENKLESQKIEKTSEKTSSESSIGDSSKQESWADAAELAHKDDIDPSEVDGLPALDSFGIRNDDGSTTVAKRHEVKPKNKPAELQKLTPKYDHSKPAEKKEATKRNHEYVKPPSDDSRPVYHDDTDKRLINPIGGFIPERADYLGFTIQRYPNVTESQIHDLHQMILRIPDAERKALQSIGVSFALSEFVKDARPEDHLRSTRTAGAEMDSVLGFFEPGTHQIVLPSKRQYSQGIDSGGTGWTLNLDNRKFSSTFFHEVGHALDKYFWKFSQSDEFGNAYKKDLLTLVNKSKRPEILMCMTDYATTSHPNWIMSNLGIRVFTLNGRESGEKRCLLSYML